MPNDTEHPNTFTFAVASDRPDGNGNHAELSGWDLARYLENPVVLFGHNRHIPPIGKASHLEIHGAQMFASIEFAPSLLGQEMARLVADNFIIGASVGWRPTTWEFRRDDHGGFLGIHSTEQELIEISIVPVPAHPDTLKVALLAAEDHSLAAGDDWLDLIIGTVPKAVKVLETETQKEVLVLDTLKQFNAKLRG